jgi:GAF domain-containing protein
MRQRDKAGGKAAKTQRLKTLKRRNAPKAARGRSSLAANKETSAARLARELKEAREQQTATADVLKVISGSAFDLKLVLEALIESATRLCGASRGHILQFNGEFLILAAAHGAWPGFTEYLAAHPFRPGPGTIAGRAAAEHRTVHVHDVLQEPGYELSELVKQQGYRTVLAVPVMREEALLGVITIPKTNVEPFTEKQIELVETFANQAVIAIENTRLLNELRESLQQQTATADVLKVISRSKFDLQSVLDTLVKSAAILCQAERVAIFAPEKGSYQLAASYGYTDEHKKFLARGRHEPGRSSLVARVLLEGKTVQIADAEADPDYTIAVNRPKTITPSRTMLGVPLLREGNLVGVFVLTRSLVQPFDAKQIELITTFADQAVIAIENARLLNELRQRTDDLSEALQQQTATSEVLRIISSSPGELEPVFNAMLANATHICEAKFGIIFQFDGERFRCMAEVGSPPVFAEFLKQQGSFQPLKGSHLDRIMRTKQVSHTADYAAEGIPSPPVKFGGARSTVDVPMLKDNELVGAFSIYRQEVRPFTDKQIALLTNFAAQAVIAIENARLLTDLNKLNQQLEQRVINQVSEIERMGRLRRFLPPQVADLIVASGTEKQLESHRREITALFCDLRGFTGFSESSDPEDVMALLREYHAAIGEIINKYGGTLERYAGDGVMVVFNDPIPVDNPALQAVLMAIDMRTAIRELIEKWRKLGHDIDFGIGIAHGFATLGTIGFEGRFDYAAIGTVSNVASRLCDEAKPGQILISPRVLMAVEKDIVVETVGDFALKGIRRPMTAYNVLATKAAN